MLNRPAPTNLQLNEKTVFAALATVSHAAQLDILIESLRAQAPDCVLVVLDVEDGLELAPDILKLSPESCADPVRLSVMRQRYEKFEYCCALKPLLIKKILSLGASQVHYVDIDMMFMGPVDPLIAFLSQNDVSLTPHFFKTLPHDGCHPSNADILMAGAFNAGYVGVANTDGGFEFVEWWREQLVEGCHFDPDRGMFVDQRWLDLAPSLFVNLGICPLKTANAGFWNLHERQIEMNEAGDYVVDGERLIFYHFSGWESENPGQISKHQMRHNLVPGTALYRLFKEYAAKIKERGAHARLARKPLKTLPEKKPVLNRILERAYLKLAE